MRSILFIVAALFFFYGCMEISGKETPTNNSKISTNDEVKPTPPGELRVGRNDANQMRKRRSNDDATVKISARDLLSLMADNPSASDSFVFYFVSYNTKDAKEKARYLRKSPKANWDAIAKKPSSLLVGFLKGEANNGMHLTRSGFLPSISVYDLGLVCPPPPNCGCEIDE